MYVTNRGIEILEPGKFTEDNGDKNAITPLDSRKRVIRTMKGLSNPTHPYPITPFLHLAKATQLTVNRHGCRGKN